MKQTLADLLYAISPDKKHPLVMTEEEVLAALPPRIGDLDRILLIERYGLCDHESLSYNQIGAKHGLSHQRVRQRLAKIVTFTRNRLQLGGERLATSKTSPDTPIIDLNLSVRTMNCLRREGIIYLRDLESYTEVGLLAIRNFGRNSLGELMPYLETAGIHIGRGVEATPEMPIRDIWLCQRSRSFLDETGAKTLADVAKLAEAHYHPDSPFWRIGGADLGRIFLRLAAAGLLAKS